MTVDDSALSAACLVAGDGRLRHGAALKFFWGPMDCGKSTMALQMNYNHARQGRSGLVLDVFAFGLASDFRSCLFPAAQCLFELADEVARIQVEVLCWCGREGQLNARVVNGEVARQGAQVVIGDTVDHAEVRYQVLCRRHHRTGDLGPRP